VLTKPPLSITAQIELLVQRGLPVPEEDKLRLARLLTDNSYARLARYWRYLQIDPGHGHEEFQPGTIIDDLADAYQYDKELRRIMADGLQDFEVTLRSRLGYFMSVAGATYTYRSPTLYRTQIMGKGNQARQARQELLDNIDGELERSREEFIVSALAKSDTPPLWDAMEVLSLGTVSKMYSLLTDENIRHTVARSFGYPNARFAESVFRALTVVRNVCAHHARVWNRTSIQIPPPVLKRLKTDPDKNIYQSTPWAWLVVLTDLVDMIRRDHTYSTLLWGHVNSKPEHIDGLKHPVNR